MSERQWVTIEKLAEQTGLSREAIWAYKKKGFLQEGKHWIKKGRRMFIDLRGFNKWIEGSEA